MPTKKKTTSKTKKKKEERPGIWKSIFQEEGGFKALLKGEMLGFIIGTIVLLIAVLLILSFVSFIQTGKYDQAYIISGCEYHSRNYVGTLGARAAYYFLNDCFGVCSFFIPIFLIFLSMKLMKTYRVRLWKWFANCAILMVWGSVAFSVSSAHFFPQKWNEIVAFSWGGRHGDNVFHYLEQMIGFYGTLILLIVVAVFYLIYITDETITVVRTIFNPKGYIDKKKAEREENGTAEEESAEEEENTTEEAEGVSAEEEETQEETEEDEEESDFAEKEKEDDEEDAPLRENEIELDLTTPPPSPVSQHFDATGEAENNGTGTSLSGEHAPTAELEICAGEELEKASGKTVEEVLEQEPYDPRKDLENYKFPTLSLLKKYTDNQPQIDMDEQNSNKDRIVNVLRNFGVEISSIKATIGPTITLYEVTPAPGVRINKIRNLEDDIALSLSALGIRIIAPIPGKGTIGIEVPNKKAQIVSMESILNSKKFQETEYELPIALGKTITNEVYMVDLAKMPHLLVAGATGQGKSVGLNAVIASLLYKKHPSELKFVMVDPKKVEFSLYTPIENHFLAKIPGEDDPIITDVTKVIQTLKSLCQLMDHRYDLLKKASVRNIKEYNARFKQRRLNPNDGHAYMPYIVVIIDEFGDLIMTAGKEVELPIARIAQLARAVGMHMVIATQRPTTNIITGTIKANFPARMAFKVMSATDSRTILDRTGANQLVGRGDMLFLHGNEPVRVQCAFIDTPEVERVNHFIEQQQGYLSAFELPEPIVEDGAPGGGNGGAYAGPVDAMFGDAARLIVASQQGSTSLIQRKFSIGFNRAGRLMDQMERLGIVGPSRGAKPREVLIADENSLENILNNLNN